MGNPLFGMMGVNNNPMSMFRQYARHTQTKWKRRRNRSRRL